MFVIYTHQRNKKTEQTGARLNASNNNNTCTILPSNFFACNDQVDQGNSSDCGTATIPAHNITPIEQPSTICQYYTGTCLFGCTAVYWMQDIMKLQVYASNPCAVESIDMRANKHTSPDFVVFPYVF